MIATCRKCGELIVTAAKCSGTATGPEAVAVGLEMMQRAREHFRAAHPAASWIVAESAGQLAALFPFLAGVDVDAAQRSVLVLSYHALKANLFAIGYESGEGVFGARPVTDAAGLALLVSPWVDPLVLAGRVELLEELEAAGVAGLGPKLDRERAALRLAVQNGTASPVVAS